MRYDTLNESQNAKLAATLRDLKAFTVGGTAILRGKANDIEQASLAALANPGKTKHLDRDDRGILAVQKMLDRAQSLLRAATLGSSDQFNFAIAGSMVPRDVCIEARTKLAETIKASLTTDWHIVQSAKTIWLAMRAKYTEEQLANPGSLTLTGTTRKPKSSKDKAIVGTVTALTNLHRAGKLTVAQLGEEFMKYEADPANYKLPGSEVAETEVAETVQEVVQVAKAATA